MMKRLLPILLTILLVACSGNQKLVVTNVHDLAVYPVKSIVYALPQTVLAIDIEAVRYQSIPGPYSEYAEQFLGISGVPRISATYWEINNVELRVSSEPDPDYYYNLHTTGEISGLSRIPEITRYGLILNAERLAQWDNSDFYLPDAPEPIHFTDLSVKKFSALPRKKEEKVPIDLPMSQQKQNSPGDLKTKAREASDFIIKIRKRRFKLLAGQYEVYPEGTALETSIRELNQLEQDYLALFIGKTYSDTVTHSFNFIPKSGQELERHVLCRFSDETGFHSPTEQSGDPIVIDLKNLRKTEALKQVQMPSSGPAHENILLYRIPDKAGLRVFRSSATLLEAEISIYQYGAFVPFSIQ